MAKQEVCAGCGAKAEAHPIIGISGPGAHDTPGYSDHPVCAACHQNPEHRTTPLKMHFFERAAREQALARAGDSGIGG